MANQPFYIVDVFAEEKYAGNQLAVFTAAGELSAETMQRFAKEMHYSETTFLVSPTPRDGGYEVRIFTPEAEIPFAGHPTLGTAFVIQQVVVQAAVETVTLNLQVGAIPVTMSYLHDAPDILWMQQQPPTFGATLSPEALAAVLNLEASAIDSRFPIQEVSTGLPCMIVPLRTLADLQQARVDRQRYMALIQETEAKLVLVFCPETQDAGHEMSVRVFADYYGVPEDPATGSANGCLAGYLVRWRYFGAEHLDIRVAQGQAIGRPSLLYLRAAEQAGAITVAVGGKVQMIAHGEFV